MRTSTLFVLLLLTCAACDPPPMPTEASEAAGEPTDLGGQRARSQAPLDGTFMFLGTRDGESTITPSQYSAYLDDLTELGMDTVIVTSLRRKQGDCDTGTFETMLTTTDLVKLLDLADLKGFEVYVGLVMSIDACPGFHDTENTTQVLAEARKVLAELYTLAPDHPALAGFYLPDEPGLGWSVMYGYYKGLVAAIRDHSDTAPILVAPYLAEATTTFTPAQVAKIASDFRTATGVTIQVWQDSVGADAVDLGSGRPRNVEAYFTALSDALGPAGVWADTELFNWAPSLFTGGGYRPASIARLNAQLWQARRPLAARRVSWLQQIHMGRVAAKRQPEAARLRASYRALYGLAGKRLLPASYRWVTPPGYSDGGAELFDMRAGDPQSYVDPAWVGVEGEPTVDIDLGSTRTVRWVGAHLLASKSVGIGYPPALRLTCLDTGSTARFPLTVAGTDGEYVLGNTTALAMACRRLRITFERSGKWTFVSEIELVGD